MKKQTPRWGQGPQRKKVDVFQPCVLILIPFALVFGGLFHQYLGVGGQKELGNHLYNQRRIYNSKYKKNVSLGMIKNWILVYFGLV